MKIQRQRRNSEWDDLCDTPMRRRGADGLYDIGLFVEIAGLDGRLYRVILTEAETWSLTTHCVADERERILLTLHEKLSYPTEACAIVRSLAQEPETVVGVRIAEKAINDANGRDKF
jgi:hypothetical protein